jgi:glycosyltransferase involved in cell wall biosynthesis
LQRYSSGNNQMTLQKGLSVFIPVFNEEEIIENNLAVLMAYLTKLGMQYEIIIVNNGSTDNSQRILKDICKKYPVVKVEYITQKAVGLAIQKGVAIARYDSFITVDMDLSINL